MAGGGAAFAVAFIVAGCLLAWRSPAFPFALWGAPAITFGLLGRNPLPNGAVELGLGCFALVAIAVALARDPGALPLRLLAAPPVLLAGLLAILIGVRGAADPEAARFEVRRFLAEGLLFLVGGAVIARRRRDLDLWALVLAATAALAGLLVTVGLAVDHDRWSGGPASLLYAETTPGALARDTSAAVLAAAYVALTARDERLRLGALTAVPLLLVAFAASGDRGPLLGLAAGLVVLLALTIGRAGRTAVLFGIVPMLAAAVPIARLFSVDGASRLAEILVGSESAQARVDEWSAAWHAFARHPLDGIGTGGLVAHDVFLDAAGELGIAGLLLVAGVVVTLAVTLVRARRDSERPRLALASALAAAAVLDAAVAGGLGTSPYLWLAAGLALGLAGELPVPRPLPAPAPSVEPEFAVATAKRDDTPPAVRIEAVELPGLSLVRITAEAVDGGSGVHAVRFQGSYDGATWDDLASVTEPPYEIDLQTAGLTAPYLVRCSVRDRVGNEAATSAVRVAPSQAPDLSVQHEPGRALALESATLWDLSRLAAAGPAGPEREEQEALLYSLRPYANVDGTIPVQLRELVRTAFGDLVE